MFSNKIFRHITTKIPTELLFSVKAIFEINTFVRNTMLPAVIRGHWVKVAKNMHAEYMYEQ